jgi:hypothetical protein
LIKAIKIERIAVDQDYWKSMRKTTLVSYLSFLAALLIQLGVLFNYIFTTSSNKLEISALVGFASGFISLASIAFTVKPLPLSGIAFRLAKNARFYIFQNVTIIVEGDIKYIYLKTQQALRGEIVQNFDIDFENWKLETILKGSWRKPYVDITIVIETVDIKKKHYSLEIDYLGGEIYYKSAFINQFINQLLSKEAS